MCRFNPLIHSRHSILEDLNTENISYWPLKYIEVFDFYLIYKLKVF